MYEKLLPFCLSLPFCFVWMSLLASHFLDGLDESFNTLSDGMDGKLKKAATYFEFDPEEIKSDDYKFRPDIQFRSGMTYEPKNVRFLANFLTDAGIIFKRSMTRISAKAQLLGKSRQHELLA